MSKHALRGGDFYASVFKRVPGVQISQTDCSDEIMFCYGKALGKLHQLSSEYVPVTAKRWSCLDVLAWIEELFIDSPQEEAALAEARLLRNYFASLVRICPRMESHGRRMGERTGLARTVARELERASNRRFVLLR